MASIKEILSSYGSAARANYPQGDPGNSKVYADDMFPEITFNYTYIGEITKSPKENKVLYECDRRACSGTCYKDCHYTPDITHAKNFECVDGLWLERHSYPEEV